MANRSRWAGITLSYAISTDQGAGCFRSSCCRQLAALDGCWLRSTSPRFRAKFLAHTNSVRFAEFLTVAGSNHFTHTRLRAQTQPNSYRDSERPDQNHSQPNSHSNSDRHSDTHAIVARAEYHPNAYANAGDSGRRSLN
jgi:hypothetical protein